MKSTRIWFAYFCVAGVFLLIAAGKIPESAMGAAFLFLGGVGTGLMGTKIVEHSQWAKK